MNLTKVGSVRNWSVLGLVLLAQVSIANPARRSRVRPPNQVKSRMPNVLVVKVFKDAYGRERGARVLPLQEGLKVFNDQTALQAVERAEKAQGMNVNPGSSSGDSDAGMDWYPGPWNWNYPMYGYGYGYPNSYGIYGWNQYPYFGYGYAGYGYGPAAYGFYYYNSYYPYWNSGYFYPYGGYNYYFYYNPYYPW